MYQNAQTTHTEPTTIKILAVDDDEFNLQILKAMLKNFPATIFTACNGQEALELLAATTGIDIVLLDLQMPVMDGFETLQRIKLNVALMHLPVIVASADEQEESRVLGLGANDFIAKPYNPVELSLRIMNHVQAKRN